MDAHDVVVPSEQVQMRKPDPEIYQLALTRLGCHGQACIFVDDIEANLRPAQDLGITTVLAEEPARSLLRLQELLGMHLSDS